MVFYTTVRPVLGDRQMMKIRHPTSPFGWRAWLALLGLVAVLGPAPRTRADQRLDLYQVAIPVPDRSDASRDTGFRDAMRVVLVRVTGRLGAASDPTFAPLVGSAGRYVQQYRYAIDGRLVVGFDGGAIERWLTGVGAPIWGRTRPITLVLLTAPGAAAGAAAIVTGDAPSDLKSAIDAQAALRGIELRWPTAQQLQADGLTDASALQTTDPRTLLADATRAGADAVLIGHATDTSANAAVQWLFEYQTEAEPATGVAAGVDRAADTYASIYAVNGATVPVEVAVDGVRTLADYARVQRLFASTTSVSRVAVLAVHADTVRWRLLVRGGAGPLVRLLSLDGSLQPAAQPGVGGELRYRLRP